MTPAVYNYVQRSVTSSRCSGDVLEIGSYDVNGSVRPIFADRNRFPSYIGTDMRPGPSVDQVMKANALTFADQTFSIVVCAEMLEHDDRFWESLREMYRVLKPGGWLILTTRNIGFALHEHPSDYWRFISSGLRVAMESAGFSVLEAVDDWQDQGTFAVGRRPL